mgnify:CR=1 FL=1
MDIKAVNHICPPINGGHEHRAANYQERKSIEKNNPKLLDDYKLCLICNPRQSIVLNKHMYCPDYKRKVIIKLNREHIKIMHRVFDKYFIPTELRIMIIKLSTIINIYHDFDTLNNETLNHMLQCRNCATDLLYTISDNICPHHIMCRKILRDNIEPYGLINFNNF